MAHKHSPSTTVLCATCQSMTTEQQPAPAIKSQGRVIRKPRRADQDGALAADIADTIGDYTAEQLSDRTTRQALAHDVIVMVRERVLREIETYSRENVR